MVDRMRSAGLVLALVTVGLVLWWLASRGSDEPEVDEPPPEAATRAEPRASHRRPAPPPRPGAIDLPSASVRADAEARAGALVGRVTSWLDASPIAEAELTFAGGGSIHSAITDADGGFVLLTPRPGEHVLASVLADGYQPYAPELGQGRLRYVARAGQRVDGVEIQLVPEIELEGEVLTPDDRPVPDAEIRWLGVGTGDAALAADDDRYTSDDGGRFRFVARLGGWLEASHPDHGVGRVSIDERTLVTARVTLRLDPAEATAVGEIAGRVLDPAGEGVEGARVLGEPRGADGLVAEAVTDADGGFVLRDLVASPHRVEARAEGYAPVWAGRVAPGSTALVLQLADGGTIEGTIVAHDGAPVPGSSVVALRHTGPLTRAQQARVTVFDARGEFRLDGLPPGTYDLVGGASDHAVARVRNVEVGTGLVEVELVMPLGGQLSGTITDATTGAPVAGARVEMERGVSPGSSVAPLRTSTLSDDAGRFVLSGVDPGRRSIHAYAIGFAPRSLSGIEVEAEAEVTDVDIALTPAEDAAGQAFDIVGIGVMVGAVDEVLEIRGTVEGGGAERAGLVEGDLIVGIDGVPVGALFGFGEAVQALRGREGTEVTLLVRRSEGDPFEVVVVRQRIRG